MERPLGSNTYQTVEAFCTQEGLNVVRFMRLLEIYMETGARPSRQALINTFKVRPKIQDRAVALTRINQALSEFTVKSS